MSEPEWLNKKVVLDIYREVINVSGGSHGVRDEGLLESALSRPQNIYAYDDVSVFDMAQPMPEAIVHNHPFIDGNKRTAFVTADIFLALNGYGLETDMSLSNMMVDLAEKKIMREKVAALLKRYSEKE